MLRQNWRLISRVEKTGDIMIILCSFFGAYYGRTEIVEWNKLLGFEFPFIGFELAPIKDYFIVLFIGFLGYMVSLRLLGSYGSMRLSTFGRLLKISLISSITVFLLLSSSLFLLKIDLSRSFIALFCILVGIFQLIERWIVLRILRYWRKRGRNFRNILICGIGDNTIRLSKEISIRPELGIGIKGISFLGSKENPALIEQFKEKYIKDIQKNIQTENIPAIISGLNNTAIFLTEFAIDEVIFSDVMEVMPEVQEMVNICSDQGIRTTIIADLFSLGMINSELSFFGGMPLIHFQTPPGERWELGIKRIIDIFISLTLLGMLSPLFIAIALSIKSSKNGSILFKQKRVGLNGRLFSLYKFRSMYANSAYTFESLSEQNEMVGPVFKITNDPRVTYIGRFLRRYSLDELPQLWNVLRGDMSIVGPRPPMPDEVNLYQRKYRRRLSMRPGLTCTWQVSGRNQIKDFQSWVKLDLEYIDNWSLSRDFLLMIKTIPAVIFGVGAS